ncbi:hypothetical protein LSAT2_013027 [Lamellibrachia satsuma]|nr:hypothetical protein LSAT2_013027 [Lamellibrachia satsuma]
MNTTLCIQAKMCATNGGAIERRLDNRCDAVLLQKSTLTLPLRHYNGRLLEEALHRQSVCWCVLYMKTLVTLEEGLNCWRLQQPRVDISYWSTERATATLNKVDTGVIGQQG